MYDKYQWLVGHIKAIKWQKARTFHTKSSYSAGILHHIKSADRIGIYENETKVLYCGNEKRVFAMLQTVVIAFTIRGPARTYHFVSIS